MVRSCVVSSIEDLCSKESGTGWGCSKSDCLAILSTDTVCKAHAMLPHLGSGVGQGFEDVLLLCHLLIHPQTKNINLEVSTTLIYYSRSGQLTKLTLGYSTSIRRLAGSSGDNGS